MGMDVRRGDGVDLRKPLVKCSLPDGGELVFDFVAEFPIGGRAIEETTQQAFEIERSATDEEHIAVASANVGNGGGGRLDILGNAVLVRRIDDIDEMMGHCGAVGGGWLGGADIHPAINRHRVERDDFGREPLGERDTDLRLADGGGASQEPAIREPLAVGSAHLVAPSLCESIACGSAGSCLNWTHCMIDQSWSCVIFMHYRTLEKAKAQMTRPLDELDQTIAARATNRSDKSYTSQLLAGGVAKIGAKITEEAAEVVEAAAEPGEAGREHLIREAGDLVYHLLVILRQRNCSLADLEAELARRAGVSGLDEKAGRKPQ